MNKSGKEKRAEAAGFIATAVVLTFVFLLAISRNLLPLGVEGEWTWDYRIIRVDIGILAPLFIFILFMLKLLQVYSRMKSGMQMGLSRSFELHDL